MEMTDAEKQLHIEKIMRSIAASLDEVIENNIGKGMGFVLILFKFGEPGITNYISNAQRAEIITGLRESANKLELGQDTPAAHGTIQ